MTRHTTEQGSATDVPQIGTKLDLILRVSARHFADNGFEATSLDQIAQEVGLHKATLYHYTDSKYEILYRCLERSFEDYQETLALMRDTGRSAEDRLRLFFANLARAQSSEFGRCLVTVGAQALDHEPGGRIRAFQRKLSTAVADVVKAGIANGEFREVPVRIATALVFGSFNWIWRWYKPEGEVSLETITDTFIDLFFRGLAAQPVAIEPHEIAPLAPTQAPAEGEKHALILKTAARFFTEKGYDATSLNDIADTVGLHKATLYHYVRSKDTILAQCLEASFANIDITEAALREPDRKPDDKLCLFLEQLVLAQNNDFGRCLNLVGPKPIKGNSGNRIRSFQRRLNNVLLKILEEGRDAGVFRPVHPGLAAAYIFGATNWVPHWHDPSANEPISRILPAIEDLFFNGILKP